MTVSSHSPTRKTSSPRRREADSGEQRLQKILAASGVGSRRQCEQLIQDGRVEVDHQVVTRLGTKVDSVRQQIRIDGELISRQRNLYYLVNKPAGVVSTSRDPSGRPRVIDLIPPSAGRLFNVGRLDKASEGLMLVTNDGQLANQLTHPRYGVEKTYEVEVAGHPHPKLFKQLEQGVRLADGVSRVVRLRIRRRRKQSTVLELVLNEGRNREIRRMLARVGHKVQRLVRIAVGPVRLGDLPPGAYRALSGDELRALRRSVARRPSVPTREKGRRR